MVASIVFAHGASIGSTLNDALGGIAEVAVSCVDVVDRGVTAAAALGGAATFEDVCVQATASDTTNAADIQRRRGSTGSLLTCFPS
jgi:hypothetical protein